MTTFTNKNYIFCADGLKVWASWCASCRRENPNLVKAYQKYRGKGFEIIGISLDENKEEWLKAIRNDGLKWTQLSDLKSFKNSVAQ